MNTCPQFSSFISSSPFQTVSIMFSASGSLCGICQPFLQRYLQASLDDEFACPLAPNFASLQLSARSCSLCQLVQQYCIYELDGELLSANRDKISLFFGPFHKAGDDDNETGESGRELETQGSDGVDQHLRILFRYGSMYFGLYVGLDQSTIPRLERQQLESPSPIHHLLSTENAEKRTYNREGIAAIAAQAKNWLDSCQQDHNTCTDFADIGGSDSPDLKKVVPTRLIDVGNDDQNCPAKLHIVTEDDGHDINYLALSYVWGHSTDFAKTTASNLREMTSALPWPMLPTTVQDAIVFTRAMRLQYLWVDAFCILQAERPDDEHHKADWRREAARCGHYYRNAVLTIAATGATSSGQGLFLPRPAISPQPSTLYFQDPAPLGSGRRGAVRPTSPEWRTEIKSSPLIKRGWATQERLLSPRILHFAANCVLWECLELRGTEADPNGLYTDGPIGDDLFRGAFKDFRESHFAVRGHWSDFVEKYSETDFSYPSDRLPALSGIAAEIQRRKPHNYIAGIWEEDLARDICWLVPRKSTCTQDFPNVNKVPSWSWAASGGRFRFFMVDKKLLQVEDWALKTHGADISGQILEARLRVRGRFRVINLASLGLVPNPDPDVRDNLLDSDDSHSYCHKPRAYLDHPIARDISLGDHPCLLICTGNHTGLVGSGDFDPIHGALILEPAGRGVDGVEAFTRIGFLYISSIAYWEGVEEITVDLI